MVVSARTDEEGGEKTETAAAKRRACKVQKEVAKLYIYIIYIERESDSVEISASVLAPVLVSTEEDGGEKTETAAAKRRACDVQIRMCV